MRIAVATRTSSRVGGVEVYLDRVIPLLQAAGHELSLWVEDGSQHALGGLSARPLGRASDALAWGPQAVWSHGLGDAALEAELAGRVPTAHFLHDYQATCLSGAKSFRRPSPRPCSRRCGAACLALYFPRGCGGRSPRTLLRAWGGQRRRVAALRSFPVVMTLSRHMQAEAVKHGVLPERTVVLPCLPPWPPPAEPGRPREVDAVRLLYVGRLERVKGLDLLLTAVPRIAAGLGGGVELHVVGQGSAEDEVRTAAARTDQRVHFHGQLSSEGVAEVMRESHLLLLPGTWPEPYGLVGVEAGQHGLPAVAFRVGGVGEWLVEGENGALAPGDPPTAEGLAKAALRCLRDPADQAHLRAGARRLALEHSPGRHLAALEEVLSRVARA